MGADAGVDSGVSGVDFKVSARAFLIARSFSSLAESFWGGAWGVVLACILARILAWNGELGKTSGSGSRMSWLVVAIFIGA